MAVLVAGSLVTGLAFSPQGNVLAVADMDRRVTLWETADLSAPVKLTAMDVRAPEVLDRRDIAETVAFSRSGRLLAVAGWGLTAALWDVANPARVVELASLMTTDDGAHQVLFSPNDRILVTCAAHEADGTGATDLWDISSTEAPVRLARIDCPSSAGPHAAISPDGRLLVTAGPDPDQVLWDISDPARPQPIANAMLQAGRITDAAFSPDGCLVVTAHGAELDFRLKIWRLP
ncbi:hypothetical protein I6A60_16555 [Frankia sp. AgB1.9]|uniref:WD40 repeat domain-containing protein n=1 Tax=unclassified Frankia TaxID=2632575 RepID=UPI00193142B6|nr:MULTISPECIES: hypothetical protein [unclassified Frankia]MBL7488038.1 hypothetical protein [Frankia sp. AgW1.1]MBL7549476.1 hypothetical protein [Frankia sp. AgB1.9]MBL7619908.1 hypothetical protein [Frankia sp. AgB1.8]